MVDWTVEVRFNSFETLLIRGLDQRSFLSFKFSSVCNFRPRINYMTGIMGAGGMHRNFYKIITGQSRTASILVRSTVDMRPHRLNLKDLTRSPNLQSYIVFEREKR